MDTARNHTFSIEPPALLRLLQSPSPTLMVDVRRRAAFDASAHMLQGAQRCLPEAIEAFAQSMPPRDVVVYCVYGHQVSQGAVAKLRELGWAAMYLRGGISGGEDGVDAPSDIAAWRAVRLPMEAKST